MDTANTTILHSHLLLKSKEKKEKRKRKKRSEGKTVRVAWEFQLSLRSIFKVLRKLPQNRNRGEKKPIGRRRKPNSRKKRGKAWEIFYCIWMIYDHSVRQQLCAEYVTKVNSKALRV